MRFEVPSIKKRGAIANAMAAAHKQRKTGGDVTGKIPCPWCRGGSVSFTVSPSGMSRGRCNSGCGIEWAQ